MCSLSYIPRPIRPGVSTQAVPVVVYIAITVNIYPVSGIICDYRIIDRGPGLVGHIGPD